MNEYVITSYTLPVFPLRSVQLRKAMRMHQHNECFFPVCEKWGFADDSFKNQAFSSCWFSCGDLFILMITRGGERALQKDAAAIYTF